MSLRDSPQTVVAIRYLNSKNLYAVYALSACCRHPKGDALSFTKGRIRKLFSRERYIIYIKHRQKLFSRCSVTLRVTTAGISGEKVCKLLYLHPQLLTLNSDKKGGALRRLFYQSNLFCSL